MRYLEGIEREQAMLLPAVVDDYVGAENPVRAIEAFIEGIDLRALGFELREDQDSGAPGYHPSALLKLFVYGYLNRIRSSRELEKAAHRNLEVIWLLRSLRPDHWTISHFRKLHREKFRQLFREFALVCRSLGLFGADVVAIDGSHFQAVNSPRRNLTKAQVQKWLKEVDAKTEEYLRALETADREAPRQGGGGGSKGDAQALREKLARLEEERQRCAQLLAELEQSPTGQISRTDPDSRRLQKGGQSVIGYNVQIAVDAQHHLMVAQEVTQDPSDWKQLAPMAEQAKETLGPGKLQVVADAGYTSLQQLQQCAQIGVEPAVPSQDRPAGTGAYPLESFTYEAETDVYLCPQGQRLARMSDTSNHGVPGRVYGNRQACAQCPVRAQCTKGEQRKLWLPEGRELLLAARERWKKLGPMRAGLVEHPFGTLKFWWGMRSFLCRGLAAVQAEFSLAALAYNFRRVLNLLGTVQLLQALRAQPAAS